MLTELNKQEISITEDKCNARVKNISESDIIVPDSKTDCIRILEVDATPCVSEKHISKDYITLSGNLAYNILYLGEGGAVETIEYNAPFSRQIDAAGCDDSMKAFVMCDVSHTEYSVINSRKINVKSVMDIQAKAYANDKVSLIESVSGDAVLPSKNGSVNHFNLAICSEHNFQIDESTKLPPASPSVDSILKYNLKITDSEIKVVLNKIVAKGSCVLTVLYMSDGGIYSAQNEIPFTHIADVEGISPDMYTTEYFETKNVSCTLSPDDDGSATELYVKADICMTIRAYDEKNVEYINDIYSPDYNIKVDRKPIPITEMIDYGTTQCTISESFVSECDVERIYSVTSEAFVEDVRINANSVTVNGFANSVIICKSAGEDNDTFSLCEQLPFSCTLPVARSYDSSGAVADAECVVEHESYSIDGGNTVKLRLIIRVNSTLMRRFCVDAVTNIEIDENDKTDKSSQSGITIYFAQAGDDMWNIAKRYHTTSSEIISVNNLDENKALCPGQQLLIPKRSK